MSNKKLGFTLIELLIVVAIIAILAAIAIPNFLAAQTRAKVSRAKGEMRTLATALESYYVDNNCYARGYRPPYVAQCSVRMSMLSTPVAYITKIPSPDPFGNIIDFAAGYDSYDYFDEASYIDLRLAQGHDINYVKARWGGHTWGRAWRLVSPGPDRVQYYAANVFDNDGAYPTSFGCPAYYDPSNGIVSNGDIIRFGGPGKLNFDDKLVGPIDNF
jgi:prepilin-type N-terminal cleavage/methylation domain-containing protein